MQLVKNNLNAVTLAIGDGANDVSMIKGTFGEVKLLLGQDVSCLASEIH